MNNNFSWGYLFFERSQHNQGIDIFILTFISKYGIDTLDSYGRSILWFLNSLDKFQISMIFSYHPNPYRHPKRPILYWPDVSKSSDIDLYIIENLLSSAGNGDYLRRKPDPKILADYETPMTILEVFQQYFKDGNSAKAFGDVFPYERIMLQYETAMNYINRHCTFFNRLVHLIY